MSSFFQHLILLQTTQSGFGSVSLFFLATAYSDSQYRPREEHPDEEDGSGSSDLPVPSSPCPRWRGVAPAQLSQRENGDSLKVETQTWKREVESC